MREDTVTTKVYKFNELSDEAKETAIEEMCDINVNHDWWKSTYEDAETIGLVIEEFDLDRNKYCRCEWTVDIEDVARLIIENHGEACETRIDADEFLKHIAGGKVDFEQADDYDPEFKEYNESDTYDELCEEFQRTICEDYLIILQKDYEYLQSEEVIIETIKVNECEFTVDGDLY